MNERKKLKKELFLNTKEEGSQLGFRERDLQFDYSIRELIRDF